MFIQFFKFHYQNHTPSTLVFTMSAEQTDSQIHSLHVRYFVQLVLYQIMITIQITLIIATIIKFKKKQKQNHLTDAERRTNDHIKFLFISVLATGSVVFALVEWYFIYL